MATYKVIQDVEAEDKLIGPLTLRQFVYAAIAAIFLYLSYFVISKGVAFMVGAFLPVALVSGFFAFPWGRDQPTELWALAKIRFMLKPRRRIWDQSGAKQLVTITAPKHIERNYSNNLSQEEVRSRLQALASTIDTRGWAVKNANVNAAAATLGADSSDRLISPALLPKPVDITDVQAADDIMDEQNNAGARRLQDMIDKSAKEHREKLIENLQKEAPEPANTQPRPNYWFLDQPAQPANVPKDMATFNSQVVEPGTNDAGALPAGVSKDEEARLLAELEERKQKSSGAYFGHMHTVKPLSDQDDASAQPAPGVWPAAPVAPPADNTVQDTQASPPGPADNASQNANAPVTPPPQAAILQLASNDDLNVATIAREAERAAPQDEVVIKLH